MYSNIGLTRKWNFLSSALSIIIQLAYIYWYTWSVNIHVWGSREILYFTVQTQSTWKTEKKHKIGFISGKYTFSVSFCISMMTPGPFISCIGNIILLDLHMKGQHILLNKKGTFFNFKELKWWTELLIGFVITHEKHRSDSVIQTQSNFFKIMAFLISSDVKGHG